MMKDLTLARLPQYSSAQRTTVESSVPSFVIAGRTLVVGTKLRVATWPIILKLAIRKSTVHTFIGTETVRYVLAGPEQASEQQSRYTSGSVTLDILLTSNL